jgi:8-oxo-dGTP diphosphatase
MADPQIVVAAAITRDGCVLAARRSYPPALAGRWELPGGKVEPGESEVAALRRECREELSVDLDVGGRVGPDVPTTGIEGLLRVYWASLARGEPHPHEHSELGWFDGDGLLGLDWVSAGDREVAEAIRHSLAR